MQRLMQTGLASSARAVGLAGVIGCLGALVPAQQEAEAAKRPPNVVVIFADDLGYGDLSCYGHPTIHTPHLDALAASGMKLTQFYVPAPLCSPSRAALLTGCYPKRVGMHRHVIFPAYDYGLHTDEVTIADALRERGYATAAFGKWHLGHRPGLMPTDQGFDEFFGVPYSNDMAQFHRKPGNKYEFRYPMMRGTEVVEWEPDQHLLTKRLTEATVRFIEERVDQPFFVYLPHPMPHIPIYASEDFEGKSPRGLYGDVIEELDWSVGQVVSTLDRLGIREDTLVLFTSDNGPWLPFGANGGSAGLLRGGKGTNWEGGQREPCIVSWPGHVPTGSVCRELTTSMDLLPTFAALTGARLPEDRVIDGHDISALLLGEPGASSPTQHFVYYTGKGELAGVRSGPFKLLFEGPELFQVEEDVSEARNLAEKRPELVAELRELAERLDAEITANARPVLTVDSIHFDPKRPKGDDPR